MIVDDDTSVDIEGVLHQILLVPEGFDKLPYDGNPCKLEWKTAWVGGSGAFFNRAVIKVLMQLIFCMRTR